MSDIESIIRRVKEYTPEADAEFIRKAYEFAVDAHAEQYRLTGEPYIVHPLATANLLVDLEMDVQSVVAALLHDVVEDNKRISLDDVRTRFGQEVASLVDGVTKLKLADFEVGENEDPLDAERSDEAPRKKRADFRRSAANLRKIFLAMARDLRVMVIKLADRTHNMSTLDGLPEERRRKVARETIEIYAPLAHRLGIWKLKWELEDLAFKYLEPEGYAEVVERVAKTREEREEDLAEASEMLRHHLAQDGVNATIQARPKHLWSIYQKMLREEVDFEEIYDLSALRVIVDRVGECYHALGLVHDLWMPIRELFSDYIAKPKSNMYQSLHTKVIGPKGEPLEVQIRTWDMHRLAEFGVAAHWQYKERTHGTDEFERKLSWLRQQLFDWQTENKEAGEFLQNVSSDLFSDQVFLFSPRGDVIDLPVGSTPVDFAYRIHSDVGNHCVGAKVNGRIVPLTYTFNNGDIVEIITRSNSQPSLDWLAFVKTTHARNRIKNYYRKINFADSAARGKELLEKELERMGQDIHALMRTDNMLHVARRISFQSEDDLYAAIGFGHLTAGSVANKMKVEEAHKPEAIAVEAPKTRRGMALSVTLDGVDTLMITRAKCCAPLPGEDVVGYVTRGKGVALHRDTCPNLGVFRQNEPERLVDITWNGVNGEIYPTDIRIKALDRIGLLNDIVAVFSEGKTNITGMRSKAHSDKTADLEITIGVPHISTLNALLAKVGSLPDVLRVERATDRMRESK